MGITTTTYKRNAAMCSIVYLCKISNRGAINSIAS